MLINSFTARLDVDVEMVEPLLPAQSNNARATQFNDPPSPAISKNEFISIFKTSATFDGRPPLPEDDRLSFIPNPDHVLFSFISNQYIEPLQYATLIFESVNQNHVLLR